MSTIPARYIFSEELYVIPAQVVVVLRQPWERYRAEDKELLEKILTFVKHSTAHVRILTRERLVLNELNADTTSSVLIFGTDLEGVQPYEATTAQGFSVISADDLPDLDPERKKLLAAGLRQMFGG